MFGMAYGMMGLIDENEESFLANCIIEYPDEEFKLLCARAAYEFLDAHYYSWLFSSNGNGYELFDEDELFIGIVLDTSGSMSHLGNSMARLMWFIGYLASKLDFVSHAASASTRLSRSPALLQDDETFKENEGFIPMACISSDHFVVEALEQVLGLASAQSHKTILFVSDLAYSGEAFDKIKKAFLEAEQDGINIVCMVPHQSSVNNTSANLKLIDFCANTEFSQCVFLAEDHAKNISRLMDILFS